MNDWNQGDPHWRTMQGDISQKMMTIDVVELDNVLNVDDAVEHVGAQLAKEPQLDNTKHRTQFQHDHIEF